MSLLKGVFLILGTWFLIYISQIANPLLLPSPIQTFDSFVAYLSEVDYWKNILATLYRCLIGLVLGILFGVPSGLILGSQKRLYSFFEFPVDFFRSLPVTALFPLFLLIFGIGDYSKIAMVTVAVYFIMLINSYYAIVQATRQRRMMAKVFKASRFQIFRDIVFMESLPQIFVGIRLSLSTSLIVVIVSEMFIGTEYGLGQRVYDLYSKNLIPNLYANLIIIGLIGYLINRLYYFVERKIVFWVGN